MHSFFSSVVSSCNTSMCFTHYPRSFIIKNTTTKYLFYTQFVQMSCDFNVKLVALTTRCFFLLVVSPRGTYHVLKKWIIAFNSLFWSSIMVTVNICMSGKLSSRLVGFSPLSILDRWYGPKFSRPGLTMTSKSNS